MVQLLSGFKEPELAKTLFIGQALHGLLFQMQKINNCLHVYRFWTQSEWEVVQLTNHDKKSLKQHEEFVWEFNMGSCHGSSCT